MEMIPYVETDRFLKIKNNHVNGMIAAKRDLMYPFARNRKYSTQRLLRFENRNISQRAVRY